MSYQFVHIYSVHSIFSIFDWFSTFSLCIVHVLCFVKFFFANVHETFWICEWAKMQRLAAIKFPKNHRILNSQCMMFSYVKSIHANVWWECWTHKRSNLWILRKINFSQIIVRLQYFLYALLDSLVIWYHVFDCFIMPLVAFVSVP